MAVPGLQLQSVAELQERLEAERAATPFLLFRDGEGRQQIVALPPGAAEVPIGREPDGGIRLGWDREVSRVHALLQRVAGAWTIVDDGLSRNGTFVNGTRVLGRRRLADHDAIACGRVVLEFRDPQGARVDETLKAAEEGSATHGLTPAQHRVLVALCRPLADSDHGLPATNKAIAAELSLSVEAVKTHLRNAAEALGVEHLPQNQKRAKLAWTALHTGLVTPRDLVAGR
ncbi:MAG TPA: FHA domain-containing protein [Solirubrobacteraceae bacterium]|nr:FHA domain-containing protein [Solirubrobacteraceae bacterium]